MKRVPIWAVAVTALVLAGVTVAQGYQPNFLRNLFAPIITGGATVSGTLTADTVKAAVVDGGTVVATGPLNTQTAIVNIATAATCSSNTGAVCVDDANGLAVANGSGTTVCTISNAGKATIATLAITATTDLGTCTIDGAGTCTGTVRANSKCIGCWDITAGTPMTCVLSGTTLSLSGGTPTNTAAWFCPTQS